ncbi:hypothetical protein, partial [Bradyrhizobium japonicum]|uniref:hypothetical protein n=1 Tax=Bradyrhizobium japonicum TaxID=375 RepID=UPI001AEC2D4C
PRYSSSANGMFTNGTWAFVGMPSIHLSGAPVDRPSPRRHAPCADESAASWLVPRHIALLVNLMLDTGTKPEELQP